eukprot:jgi/Tetstr1/461928/TSEL_007006.t1
MIRSVSRPAGLLVALLLAVASQPSAARWYTPSADTRHASYHVPATFERLTADNTWMFYHHHIPKTAGRSFYRYFRKEGHPEGINICLQRNHPTDPAPPGEECQLYGGHENFCQELVAQLKAEEHAHHEYRTCNMMSFESTNFTWDITQHLTMPRLKVMTLLREPIAHYVSQFMHDRAWGRVETMDQYLNQLNERGYNTPINGNLLHRRLGAHTLEAAKALLVGNVFFFGFMDYWHESLCLLSYQLNLFDRTLCNLCGDEALEMPAEGFTLSQRFFMGSKRTGVKKEDALENAQLSVNQLKEVQAMNAMDVHLYTWAVEVFKARVRQVEQEEGVGILCE